MKISQRQPFKMSMMLNLTVTLVHLVHDLFFYNVENQNENKRFSLLLNNQQEKTNSKYK